MAKAVFGCKKLRSWTEIGGTSNHLRRSIPTPNADPVRLTDNKWVIGGPDVERRVRELIESHGVKPRANAVLAEEVLLSIGPDFFRPKDPEKAGTWRKDRLRIFQEHATNFLKETFGDRVAAAVLHLDESTPHIQAVIVPLVERKDGKWGLNAKETFSPVTMTKMRREYQKPLVEKYGVEPCDESARLDNVPIKKYYGTAALLIKNTPEVKISSRPPVKKFGQSAASYEKLVDEWLEGENSKLSESVIELTKTAIQGKLKMMESKSQAEAMKHIDMGYNDLYTENKILSAKNVELAELLNKEEVAGLRKINLSIVAERLGYFGDFSKGENAIDLVKRVNEFSYLEALNWLYNEFGAKNTSEAAAEYIERHLNLTAPEKPLTKSQKAKRIVVDQQLSALNCDKYRITLMWTNKEGRKVGWNLGKDKEGGLEKYFSKQDVLNKIPDLEVKNHDMNVFVTPIDDDFYYILVDDLKDEGKLLKERGFSPCLLQKSSDSSTQAVLKVPKNRVSKEKANEFFKSINRELGDEKITGLSHPFRLAGFRNVKPRHVREDGLYPLVKVLEARGRLCERTIEAIMGDRTPEEDLSTYEGRRRP